jgi:hypothetical protein
MNFIKKGVGNKHIKDGKEKSPKKGYSGSIPAMRMTLPHLAISEEMKLANSLGELPTGSKPR